MLRKTFVSITSFQFHNIIQSKQSTAKTAETSPYTTLCFNNVFIFINRIRKQLVKAFYSL